MRNRPENLPATLFHAEKRSAPIRSIRNVSAVQKQIAANIKITRGWLPRRRLEGLSLRSLNQRQHNQADHSGFSGLAFASFLSRSSHRFSSGSQPCSSAASLNLSD